MNKIKSRREKRFSVLLTIVMVLVMVITVYPVWYSLINSLNSAQDIAKNGYAMLLPGEFSLESWKSVLKNTDIFRAFGITLSRTLIVTVVQTLFTAMFAYGFSRDNLVGKKFYTVLGFIIMYLNGGVIAYFILFNAIPESLFESAKIDGASEYTIFFRLVIPLSKPVISALGIFTAVATWNDYTQTLYYTKSSEIQTLSYYMLSITKASASAAQLGETMSAGAASVLTTVSNSSANYKTIELACMVLSALPLIIMYPFAQKFFEKGVMVGSVKG